MAKILLSALVCFTIGAAMVRADDPQTPASGPIIHGPRLVLPSDTGRSIGYHVGGGNTWLRRAEPRNPDEGTWGWDYQGWLLPRRVVPGWWHGRRYQGGTGSYQTDGPRLYR